MTPEAFDNAPVGWTACPSTRYARNRELRGKGKPTTLYTLERTA